MDDKWRCVVADYGFARKARKGAAMTICGSDNFMAPEVIWGEVYDERADVSGAGPAVVAGVVQRLVRWLAACSTAWARVHDGSSCSSNGRRRHSLPSAVAIGDCFQVFSFGVVLWEIIYRKVPGQDGFAERGPRTKFKLDIDALKDGAPADAPASLVNLAASCCAYEPDDRITSDVSAVVGGRQGRRGRACARTTTVFMSLPARSSC